MNDKEKRDFLLKEIQKRIVGPGYTQETYACDKDASDEILVNRPQIVYTSGILFPIRKDEDDDLINQSGTLVDQEIINDEGQENNEDLSDNQDSDITNNTGEDGEDVTEDEREEPSFRADDYNKFQPSHIGLITCLDSETNKITIEIDYGRYIQLPSEEIEKNVHVKLGRCSVSQLKETFAYYNEKAKNTLEKIGVGKMEDMFVLDETNRWLSPTGYFFIKEEGKNPRRPNSKDFPALPQNRVASIINKLIKENGKIKLSDYKISEDDFIGELKNLERIPEIQGIIKKQNKNSLQEFFEIKSEIIKIKEQDNLSESGIQSYLFKDDPVKDSILESLFQYRFFKREKVLIGPKEIELKEDIGEEKLNEDLKIDWKLISKKDSSKKYLHILLSNINVFSQKTPSQSFIMQPRMKISSKGICSYSEQHRSTIDDKEYEINEVLYSEELVYAKGVNCAATWEENESPSWVQTTYTPQKLVPSFSPTSEYKEVEPACQIFDMTIWSQILKKDIISRFRVLADKYKSWHEEQISLAGSQKEILNSILDEQEYLYKRLQKNIDFLNSNEDAYRCFLLANTAMYIQMILGRDVAFRSKGRDLESYEDLEELRNCFNSESWDYFSSATRAKERNLTYRPFQLVFLLLNIESTFNDESEDRKEIVDLIWFPTGGGKTEAYLALSAFTIACRRLMYPQDKGVSVIMRYTLRLLTAQQFERATFLICALEYLRLQLQNRKDPIYSLGNSEISIGMWIGKSSTPNDFKELKTGKYLTFFDALCGNKKEGREASIPSHNPFPVSNCPWCGCNLAGKKGDIIEYGYKRRDPNLNLECINEKCYFHEHQLPIYFIDEQLYRNPPTLLFATVDKFAQLTNKNSGKLFGIGTKNRKPDLIIQDELHLISGPLGSIVGMFESLVEELCTERDQNDNITRKPKIIASTATTRNTTELVKQLYARNVFTFPVSGVRYSNNFFSRLLDKNNSKRLYSGLIPTGHTVSELELRTISAFLVAKERLILQELIDHKIDLSNKEDVILFLFKDKSLLEELDNYWSLVVYYKDKKSLGRTNSRISQEIKANVDDMKKYTYHIPQLDFVLNYFYLRTNELTGRQESRLIRQLLNEASARTKINYEDGKLPNITSKLDIIQATNMISVGIDIPRWNIMVMMGHPMTTSEYIQSSSRVGRSKDGLVINILSPARTRELSLFENYEAYHQVFYKYVEPLSVTTFTEMTLFKLATILYICYMVFLKGKNKQELVTKQDIKDLIEFLRERSLLSGSQYRNFDIFIEKTITQLEKIFNLPKFKGKSFSQILSYSEYSNIIKKEFPIMNSLRDVESNTYIVYE